MLWRSELGTFGLRTWNGKQISPEESYDSAYQQLAQHTRVGEARLAKHKLLTYQFLIKAEDDKDDDDDGRQGVDVGLSTKPLTQKKSRLGENKAWAVAEPLPTA